MPRRNQKFEEERGYNRGYDEKELKRKQRNKPPKPSGPERKDGPEAASLTNEASEKTPPIEFQHVHVCITPSRCSGTATATRPGCASPSFV